MNSTVEMLLGIAVMLACGVIIMLFRMIVNAALIISIRSISLIVTTIYLLLFKYKTLKQKGVWKEIKGNIKKHFEGLYKDIIIKF